MLKIMGTLVLANAKQFPVIIERKGDVLASEFTEEKKHNKL
jgi:hypothetical protein